MSIESIVRLPSTETDLEWDESPTASSDADYEVTISGSTTAAGYVYCAY
jgi:hypothetical protein